MSDKSEAAEKTVTIEYLGTRGNPLVIPDSAKRTWEKGDKSAENAALALELIEQGGFRRVALPSPTVAPPAAPEEKPKKAAAQDTTSAT
jgi:hypothetical protein